MTNDKYRIIELEDSLMVISGKRDILFASLNNNRKTCNYEWIGQHIQKTRNEVIDLLIKRGYAQ